MQKSCTSRGRMLLFKFFLFYLGVCVITSCKDKDDTLQFNPNKPSVFYDYAPKEGAVRTRLYIQGENFGTDISRIRVYIGDKPLKVIGSNGTEIYCMVPRKTTSGSVKVIIDGNQPTEYTFPDPFVYTSTISV